MVPKTAIGKIFGAICSLSGVLVSQSFLFLLLLLSLINFSSLGNCLTRSCNCV